MDGWNGWMDCVHYDKLKVIFPIITPPAVNVLLNDNIIIFFLTQRINVNVSLLLSVLLDSTTFCT